MKQYTIPHGIKFHGIDIWTDSSVIKNKQGSIKLLLVEALVIN